MKKLLLLTAGLILLAPHARAVDVGDPLYKADLTGNVRVEVFYENFDRDVQFDDLTIKLHGPGGTASGSAPVSGSSAQEDLYIVRLTGLLGERAAVYVDAGVVDDDSAEDVAYMIGLGARASIYRSGAFDLSAVGNFHYVPDFDLDPDHIQDPTFGEETVSGKIHYYELAGGFLASGRFAADANTKFVPYAGFLLSALEGSTDAHLNFPQAGVSGDGTADFHEDTVPVGVVGASLVFKNQYSLRAEGRLIGDSSFSVGLGVAL